MVSELERVRLFILNAFIEQQDTTKLEAFVDSRDWESNEVLTAIRGSQRGKLSADDIERFKQSLPALTETGLKCLLPQYMLHGLENVQSDVNMYLLYFLSRPMNRKRLESLSLIQKKAIFEFLSYAQKMDPDASSEDEHYAEAFRLWNPELR